MSENLNKALDNILKKHGKGSVLQGDEKVEYERIPTGSLGLDIITGGGYPIGRFVEVYAPESSGKTTVAIHGMIQAQKKYPNKRVAIIDAEHAFDRDYAEGLGLKMDEVLIVQPDCIWEEEMVMDNYGLYNPLKDYSYKGIKCGNGIVQLDCDMNFISQFRNCSEAARSLNLDTKSHKIIHRALSSKTHNTHGYKWLKYDDYLKIQQGNTEVSA